MSKLDLLIWEFVASPSRENTIDRLRKCDHFLFRFIVFSLAYVVAKVILDILQRLLRKRLKKRKVTSFQASLRMLLLLFLTPSV